ncbi:MULTISPECIES: ABC1 kinase family protein [unclassified Moraxella]|uniref:ABC1 kinase family protein n=1 Tax=unclassified Moraxella TaxID=2685852 RepID=UPI003AF6E912
MSSKTRFLKLAGMTASITGKAVKSSIKSIAGSEEDKLKARSEMLQTVGLQIADTLGEMKGAVMKVGQIASQYKDVFPPEVAKALEKLQKDAPPMPFATIKQQVERELGKPMSELFLQFDEQPFAAASIGQVHKAVLPCGQAVVVKVQYPDIDNNIDSDLKQVRLALKITGMINMDKSLQEQIFTEIRNSLYDELDYTKEAHNLAIFANFHANDTGLIIPKVFASHSSKRILTLSQELGEKLEVASTWDNEVKQKIATQLFRFSAGQLFQLYRLHCDPHPGNFAFRPDGSVVAYDFGGIKSYSHDEVALFQRFAKHCLKGDVTALEQDLIAVGVKKDDDQPLPPQFYQDWLQIGLTPYGFTELFDLSKHAPYDFSKSQTHHQAIAKAKESLKYWQSFQPSPLTMMLDRTISGQYWNLVNLGVSIDLSELMGEYIELPALEKS